MIAEAVEEEWRPVVGQEGAYEVSSLGRVRSLDRAMVQRLGSGRNPDRLVTRRMKGRLLSLSRTAGRYLGFRLGLGGNVLVQTLVAAAFIGPRPPGLMVLHGDGDGHHNAATNLRYGDGSDNTEDSRRHGTMIKGEAVTWSKLTTPKASAIRALRGTFTQPDLAAVFQISRSVVQGVQERRKWRDAPDITPVSALSWMIYHDALLDLAARPSIDRHIEGLRAHGEAIG